MTKILLLLAVLSSGVLVQDMSLDIEVGSKRSPTPAMNAFRKQTGYQKGRPGWVIDHVVPMCAGGPDAVSNLQWQEAAASYRKDVFERALCVAMKRQGLIIRKEND